MTKIQDLSPQQVAARLKIGGVELIDVREPAEYAAERIHGAMLFPLSTFDPHALPKNVDIIFQCGTGKRSAMAAAKAQAAGLAHSAHLAGGIQAWKAAGLPTIAIDPATGKPREK
ncbi:MAG TPA: rhodanese-like domain-containing protein [Dongiaceae bacterium]|jgi:rhodanese-related sulfurtransferase|nr:rhodanese-like domain-containing protein [Dongiaceae bacterium]